MIKLAKIENGCVICEINTALKFGTNIISKRTLRRWKRAGIDPTTARTFYASRTFANEETEIEKETYAMYDGRLIIEIFAR